LKTRLFEFAGEGELLLPVVDMANHYNGCPHSGLWNSAAAAAAAATLLLPVLLTTVYSC
jgi:hypothetical protein